MNAARNVKTDLTEYLRELHLPAIRRCFEEQARQAGAGNAELRAVPAGTFPNGNARNGVVRTGSRVCCGIPGCRWKRRWRTST